MRKLLTDLDSNSFEVREAAVKRLKELGPQAERPYAAALQADHRWNYDGTSRNC